MPNLSLKQKIMLIVAIIGALLILIFQRGFYGEDSSASTLTPSPVITQTNPDNPEVVSTNPSPLEEAVILPNQTVEITFNMPIENVGEFKNRLDPSADYKIGLSDDRKTAKIIPITPFKLGLTYTLFINRDTKFDIKKLLGRDITYHFKTVDYRGI